MKKLSLITLALLTLLLAQCKKEKIDSNGTNANKVKVRCEIPMGNSGKTDFTDPLISLGSIKWSQGIERIYLAVSNTNSNLAQIVELVADNTSPSTELTFEGTVNPEILTDGKAYEVWYFGNSHDLETPYVSKTLSDNVITEINGNIATQSGDIDDLGYHHIMKANVTATKDSNGNFNLPLSGPMESQIAIAYMDLSKVTSLKGNAIVGTEFSLSKNAKGTYSFEINNENNKVINIAGTNENLAKSYVVLFPNTKEMLDILNVDIDNNYFYRHTFENGIAANTFYYKYLSDLENATLKWEYYPFLNGHEFVDLGLESGTKWAKYNIGVDPNNLTVKADYFGDYYQWGQLSSKCYGLNSGYKPVETDEDISGTEYDVVRYKWEDEWCMPTEDQMLELINCTWSYTYTYNGIDFLKGYKIIGPNGNHIFLPAAGYKIPDWGGGTWEDNDKIHYWTSSPEQANDYSYARYLQYNQYTASTIYGFRYYGNSIRPVFAPSNSNK